MVARKEGSGDDTSAREFIIVRIFNAPRELVFRAWTEPNHLESWISPKGFKNETLAIDVRPGGVWRYNMHSPDGDEYNNKIVFGEIVRPERLTYTHGSDDEPDQFKVKVTLEDQGAKTKLTMQAVFPTVKDWEESKRFGAVQGGNSTLDRLAEELMKMGNAQS